jgi:hypothetical protein
MRCKRQRIGVGKELKVGVELELARCWELAKKWILQGEGVRKVQGLVRELVWARSCSRQGVGVVNGLGVGNDQKQQGVGVGKVWKTIRELMCAWSCSGQELSIGNALDWVRIGLGKEFESANCRGRKGARVDNELELAKIRDRQGIGIWQKFGVGKEVALAHELGVGKDWGCEGVGVGK